jgi:hypothetical protein
MARGKGVAGPPMNTDQSTYSPPTLGHPITGTLTVTAVDPSTSVMLVHDAQIERLTAWVQVGDCLLFGIILLLAAMPIVWFRR